MGTNYYIKVDVCPHCGRCDEKIHVGKSSVGWAFLFHSIDGIATTYKEWEEMLKQHYNELYSAYNVKINVQDFLDKVEAKKNERKGEEGENHYLDEDGYRFSRNDFS